VISYALAKGHVLVTQERPAPQSKKKVMIPDVCEAVSVAWKDTFQVLGELRARFILDMRP